MLSVEIWEILFYVGQRECVLFVIHILTKKKNYCVLSIKIPNLEEKPNLTALDIQIKKLRDSALQSIMEGAKSLFEEATDVSNCLSVIEGWLDKLKQLAEEVCLSFV